YRWRTSTGMVLMQQAQAEWIVACVPTGCSHDASVVSGYALPADLQPIFPVQALMWDAGGQVTLLPDLAGAPQSWAWGVSADGSTIVGQWQTEAALWQASDQQRRSLGGGIAYAATADASIVIGIGASGGGARWLIGGATTDLGA